jgi:PhnB protein
MSEKSAVPYLSVRGAAQAIEFYKKAFGAVEVVRLPEPGGRLGHAEIIVAGARIMLADEYPELGFVGPQALGGSPVAIQIDVEDVDALVARAQAAGATVLKPPTDEFYGDRAAKLRDPFGHEWSFETRLEEMSPEEMRRRYDELVAQAQTDEGRRAASPVKPIPDGHHVVTPYLIVEGAERVLDFMKRVFDAKETLRVDGPDGTIGHAELRIGDSMVMLGNAGGPWKPIPASLHIYVADVDATYHKALAAGATSVREPADQPYGDRSAGVRDATGNTWWLARHIADVPLG